MYTNLLLSVARPQPLHCLFRRCSLPRVHWKYLLLFLVTRLPDSRTFRLRTLHPHGNHLQRRLKILKINDTAKKYSIATLCSQVSAPPFCSSSRSILFPHGLNTTCRRYDIGTNKETSCLGTGGARGFEGLLEPGS